MVSRPPTAEFACEATEEFERLLALLPNESLRRVAFLKMQGYTENEIAEQADCTARTVRRHLQTIRALWAGEASPA